MSVETQKFLKDLSQWDNIMGGGSGAALVAGVAAALTHKVLENEWKQGRHNEKEKEIQEQLKELIFIRDHMEGLVLEDSKALQPLIKAYKLPKHTEKEKDTRQEKIQKAIKEAAKPQLEILYGMDKLLKIHDFILNLKPQGEIVTNLKESNYFARAAIEVAEVSTSTNFDSLIDYQERNERQREVEELVFKGKDKIKLNLEKIKDYLKKKNWD